MELVADVKKKVTNISKRLNKDMDGFNHLETIHRKLDDVIGIIEYMESKIELRDSRNELRDSRNEKVVSKKSVKAEKLDTEIEKVDFDD